MDSEETSSTHTLHFIEESRLSEQIEKAAGEKKRVLVRYREDALPLINTEGLDVALLEKEDRKKFSNTFLVDVCTMLSKEYDCIFIAAELEDEYTSFFEVFMDKYCQGRNTRIYCGCKEK
ncbi:hypothetical protein NEMIN01_0868 [Nematocida minor]|uniref:uncharacterized protein n=1 Tax=Nematocida minor TaxID=1912983 RepID=UPI00221F0BBC|nr:uncharacterized protein NEMIN01_0868 [Nematocida minor]KAI5190083.1 hypothetical protein NEMIN01_0868 [Nematocida minor]